MKPLDPLDMTPRIDVISENYEISINFVNTREKLDRNLLVVDDKFVSIVAFAVLRENMDPEPMNIIECRHRHD